jgi:hypothetical protein
MKRKPRRAPADIKLLEERVRSLRARLRIPFIDPSTCATQPRACRSPPARP